MILPHPPLLVLLVLVVLQVRQHPAGGPQDGHEEGRHSNGLVLGGRNKEMVETGVYNGRGETATLLKKQTKRKEVFSYSCCLLDLCFI